MLTGFFLTVDQLPVGDDLEHAARTGDQFNPLHASWTQGPQFGRQTGGSGLVVSHLTELDGEVPDHGVILASKVRWRKRWGTPSRRGKTR